MHCCSPGLSASAVLVKGGKGKEGDGKNKSWQIRAEHLKDDKEIAMLSSAVKNLALTHAGKTLCLRYNRQACTNKQCKYLHACAIKLPNGNACGLRHAAHQHRFRTTPKDSANAGHASNAPSAVAVVATSRSSSQEPSFQRDLPSF